MPVNIYVDGTQYTNIEQVKFPTNSNSTTHEVFYSASDASILTENDLLEGKIAYGNNGKTLGKVPRLTDIALEPGTFAVMLDYDTNKKTLEGYFTPEGSHGAYINGQTKITAQLNEDLHFTAPGDGVEHQIFYDEITPIDGNKVGVLCNIKSGLLTPSSDLSGAIATQLKLTTSSENNGYTSKLIDCGAGRFVALIGTRYTIVETDKESGTETSTTYTRALQAIPIKINLSETDITKKIIKGKPINLSKNNSSAYQMAAIPLRSELSTNTNYIYVVHTKDSSNYYLNHFILELIDDTSEGSPGFTCKIMGEESYSSQLLSQVRNDMGQYAIEATILNGPKDPNDTANWEIIVGYRGINGYPYFSQVNIINDTKEIIIDEDYLDLALITSYTHGNQYCFKVARMNDNRFALLYTSSVTDTLKISIIEKKDGAYHLLKTYDCGSNYAALFDYVVLNENVLFVIYSINGNTHQLSVKLIDNQDGTYNIEPVNTDKTSSQYLGEYSSYSYNKMYLFRLNEGSIFAISNYGDTQQYLYGLNILLNDSLTKKIGQLSLTFDSNTNVNNSAFTYYLGPGDLIYSSDIGSFLTLGFTSSCSNSGQYRLGIIPLTVSRTGIIGIMGESVKTVDNITTIKERFLNYHPRFDFK